MGEMLAELVADPEDTPSYAQYRFRVPPGATEVLLIRHGESAPMAAGEGFPVTATGQADPELSPLGREQAQRLADRLASVHLDALYITSLQRTAQTAAPLAGRMNLVPRIEPDLREIGVGDWEGGEFRRRAIMRDPRMVELLRGGGWSLVPGGEDPEKFAARVRAALCRIQAAHPGERVAAICHGGVIGQAIALATGARPLAFMTCDNTSISQLILHEEHWTVRGFNDTDHLGSAFSAATSTGVDQ
jgi:2,3-bisphosphoglycerate-dependent phosphoglycerate mutase